MRYAILGTTQAEDDQGTSIPLGGPRTRALLTALALHPDHPVPTPTLISEVWTDTPPTDAPAALQALIARLRRALGRHTITSEPGGYRLATAPTAVDLFTFERLVHDARTALSRHDPATAATTLREALTLWRGPALADLPDRTAVAVRPETLRTEALRIRIEADLQLGRAPDVVPELRELTAAHPHDEPLHALLIRALHETGRTAEALTTYEHIRRTLRDSLGTDPGHDLRALHQSLLTAQPPPQNRLPVTPTPARPRTGNLRPRLTSFVGRERELEAIRSDLRGSRLVTLTGPGGSGKTRLAEEAASGHPQAWLAELAPLDRPEAVPGAVVSALDLRETALIPHDLLLTHETSAPHDDPLALLVEYCAHRDLLLILDNCEHVIDAAATLAETLLTHCPGLTILATSREPLGVPGESVRPVDPLLPAPAHRLFAERAASVRPDANTVLRADPGAVAEICHRLDGLPLAIELAAARLRLLTPRQIADRLDDRFRLLTLGSRTALPRQQTLRAVVDWSWDLLDESERTVLREVSVFAGGWDLEAAETVCTEPESMADILGALVDKSLIIATPSQHDARSMRYRMLETIHEYATERAAETPALREAAELRHRTWILTFLTEAEPRLRSADQLPWIHRLETDLDNIRAALHRALTAGDEPAATDLALAMGWFWWLRNFRHEGAHWLDRILTLTTSTGGAGGQTGPGEGGAEAVDHIAAFLADPAPSLHPRHHPRIALRLLHLALVAESGPIGVPQDPRAREYVARLRQESGHTGPAAARFPGLVWPLTAYVLDGAAAVDIHAMMDEAVTNCRTYGGDWELGFTLMLRTHMLVDSPGNMRGVEDDLAELRTIAVRVGDRWMRAQVAGAAGEAAMARGRFTEAKGEYEEALRLAYEVGANTESPFLIARLGEIAHRLGDREAALTALDEATAAADRFGAPDSRAFVCLLRAHMALVDGETTHARDLWHLAREETHRGTPPPQFKAFLDLVDGLLTTAESGPEPGLRRLTDALRTAVDNRCAETVTAAMADSAATVLSGLGDHPCAVRLLAAGTSWRGGHPRPLPDRHDAERAETAALAALGPTRYEAEHTTGTAYTPTDALHDLAKALKPIAAPDDREDGLG
ncbi:BTAD domain-containing putative transcriptional regulator [Streptomyces sp. DSM 40750]|uniref:BTAD domain-containing putative transcriptional regulator n=1 Tax=Streptomyces sp. DSM 40750 TaxID=2801030 RepID=UPI00214C2B7F|nr:BTAD domain-containing putative transcriptional regulator [Streptomyces sp. DSM 40750]UUU23231.1 winged helix-turn-helix domain-containing protein [Streptomyces sp. DSM 40750]